MLKRFFNKTKTVNINSKQQDKRRVLMFAPYSFPPTCAESIVTSKFIYTLLKTGWEIDVIAFQGAVEWYLKDDNNILSVVRQSVHFIGSKRIQEAIGLRFGLMQWIIRAVFLGIKLTRINKYDFILSRATPLCGHLPALLVQAKTKTPWIANWSDPMPSSKAPPPYGYGYNAKLGILQNMYLHLVSRYAHYHTFPCEGLRQYYALYLPQIYRKSGVVPHIALNNFQVDMPINKQKFVICYAGSLTLRPLDVLFAALSKLKHTIGKNILFEFTVHNKLEVMDKARQYVVAAMVTVNNIKNYFQTLDIMRKASVALIIEANLNDGIYLVSKVSDIVQIGKPILALSPRIGVLNDLITQHGGGMVVDNQSVDAVVYALETLFYAWQNNELQEKYGSGHLMSLFGEDVVLETFNYIVDCALE